jgi:ATP-dependent Clp protease protease subunit
VISMKAHIDRFRAATRGMPRFQAVTRAATKESAEYGELYIYDAIGGGWFGGVGAQDVATALAAFKANGVKKLDIYINSPGGDVFDGVAIYNLIHRFDGEKTCVVDGLAASAASLVAMSAPKIHMAANSMMMIHDPWGGVIGNSADMRKTADELDKITDVLVSTYATRTKGDAKEIRTWMAEETWMTADEAKGRGFCDVVLAAAEGDDEEESDDSAENSAHPLVNKFEKTPADLRRAARMSAAVLINSMQRRIENAKLPGKPGRTTTK